jgi:hypothetical protein
MLNETYSIATGAASSGPWLTITDTGRRDQRMGTPVRKVVVLSSLCLKLISRRDKQHRGITLGLGGLYPEPEAVRAILAPQDGVTKRIIDLGQYSPSEFGRI